MFERVLRWLVYNVVFAALPFGLSAGVRALASLTAPDGAYVPELLFLVLMLAAHGAGDITEFNQRHKVPERALQVGFPCLILVALVTAVLYGGVLYSTLVAGRSDEFLQNTNTVSKFLTLITLIATGAVQFYLGRLEAK